MYKDKITPENYKGYCELFKSKYTTNEQMDRYYIQMFKSGIIPGILFVAAVMFKVSDLLVLLSIINFIVVPPVALGKSMIDDKKKFKKEFTSKYPDIDVNLTTSEIENLLMDSKILRCGVVNGQYRKELDIEGYENYIKCENVKQEVIDDWKKLPLEGDYSISPEELEKAKVKVKTMSKRGM